MTLFKQLFWGTSIAFLIVLAATETIYIRNAHKYLQQQLASHAQDAATSLGLVLPIAMADNDMIRAEVTVNSLFDRGYYQSIRIINMSDETVVLKTLSPVPAEVPAWFVKTLPLEAPSAESLVTKGWRQLGRVVVTSHPNFAYKQLWQTLLEATVSLLFLYFLSLAALHSFLTRILKPLRAIEQVAHAVSDRDFQLIEQVPRARELRNVVIAINSMSAKLRGIIEHEVKQAIRFRDESTKDTLTGMENRRGFDAYMESLLEGGKNLNSGALFMLQISNFHDFNSQNGFQKGDGLLQDIAAAIKTVLPNRDLLRGRFNGVTFVVVATNVTRDEAFVMGAELCNSINGILEATSSQPALSLGCGAAYFADQVVTLPSLLSQADMAMLKSFNNGKGKCVLQELTEDGQAKGSQYWKQLIQDAISGGRLTLFAQMVMGLHKEERLQIEVVGRLKDENGDLVPADQFIPMANRHRLTPSFDLAILQKLFERMSNGVIADQEVAINLSVHSIHDVTLLDWLTNAMRADRDLSRRLVFEFTEFGLVQDKVGVEKFVAEIRKLGANFAVDNFGLHPSAFEYLQQLKPRYVKLSPAYIRELANNQKHQFFISSVVMITRPLEIQVIALGIENVDSLALLKDLGVDGYQGFVTGKLLEIV